MRCRATTHRQDVDTWHSCSQTETLGGLCYYHRKMYQGLIAPCNEDRRKKAIDIVVSNEHGIIWRNL